MWPPTTTARERSSKCSMRTLHTSFREEHEAARAAEARCAHQRGRIHGLGVRRESRPEFRPSRSHIELGPARTSMAPLDAAELGPEAAKFETVSDRMRAQIGGI